MKRLLILAAALIAAPTLAHAQVGYPPTPGTSVDLGPLQARIDAANAAATAAKAKADTAAADAATAQATAAANAAAAADVAAAKSKADAAATAAAAAQAKADAATTAASTASTTASTANTTASTAQTTANAAAAVAAAACQPMQAVPPIEVVGGTTGTGQNCRLVNAADNRITRTGVFTTGANGMLTCGGTSTCTWDQPLPAGAASYPMFFTDIGVAGTMLTRCKVVTSTNAGFSAQCRQEAATISLLGASVSILAPTGVKVYALALPSTQADR